MTLVINFVVFENLFYIFFLKLLETISHKANRKCIPELIQCTFYVFFSFTLFNSTN